MYRCRKCGNSSNLNEPMLKQTIFRLDERGRKQTHTEIPLCASCHAKEPAEQVISPAASFKPKLGDVAQEL